MLKRDAIWLGLDAVLAALFLWASSSQWLEPELRGEPGVSGGGPFAFVSILMLFFAPWLALHVTGLVVGLRGGLRGKNWLPLVVCLSVVAWYGLVMFSAMRVV